MELSSISPDNKAAICTLECQLSKSQEKGDYARLTDQFLICHFRDRRYTHLHQSAVIIYYAYICVKVFSVLLVFSSDSGRRISFRMPLKQDVDGQSTCHAHTAHFGQILFTPPRHNTTHTGKNSNEWIYWILFSGPQKHLRLYRRILASTLPNRRVHPKNWVFELELSVGAEERTHATCWRARKRLAWFCFGLSLAAWLHVGRTNWSGDWLGRQNGNPTLFG